MCGLPKALDRELHLSRQSPPVSGSERDELALGVSAQEVHALVTLVQLEIMFVMMELELREDLVRIQVEYRMASKIHRSKKFIHAIPKTLSRTTIMIKHRRKVGDRVRRGHICAERGQGLKGCLKSSTTRSMGGRRHVPIGNLHLIELIKNLDDIIIIV